MEGGDRFPGHWPPLLMPSAPGAEIGWSWVLGTKSGVPTRRQRASPLSPRVCRRRKLRLRAEPELRLRHSNMERQHFIVLLLRQTELLETNLPSSVAGLCLRCLPQPELSGPKLRAVSSVQSHVSYHDHFPGSTLTGNTS